MVSQAFRSADLFRFSVSDRTRSGNARTGRNKTCAGVASVSCRVAGCFQFRLGLGWLLNRDEISRPADTSLVVGAGWNKKDPENVSKSELTFQLQQSRTFSWSWLSVSTNHKNIKWVLFNSILTRVSYFKSVHLLYCLHKRPGIGSHYSRP